MTAKDFDNVPREICDIKHIKVDSELNNLESMIAKFMHGQNEHNHRMQDMVSKIFDKIDDINRQGLGIQINSLHEELLDHKENHKYDKSNFISWASLGISSIVALFLGFKK